MANPQAPMKVSKYYFMNDATRIVYYSEELPQDTGLVYIGTSDNPKPAMAAAAFLQQGKITQGFRLRNMDDK